jgi:hypothetical protein
VAVGSRKTLYCIDRPVYCLVAAAQGAWHLRAANYLSDPVQMRTGFTFANTRNSALTTRNFPVTEEASRN